MKVTSLPSMRRGRPLVLEEKLEVRERGGVLTTAITMASATAVVRHEDRNLLLENRGSIDITANWAKSLLYRMGFVKRRGTTTIKIAIQIFD